MKHFQLEDMTKGWFVGNFAPTAHSTDACEVAIKHYQAGDWEGEHHHKVATEITVVVSGRIQMLAKEWGPGDILVLEPDTPTDFRALTDAICAVVKLPGVLDDKYIGRP